MRLDFETGIAFGQALQRLTSVETRVSRIEPRVDRLEIVLRTLLLAVLAAGALATNIVPREIAELLLALLKRG